MARNTEEFQVLPLLTPFFPLQCALFSGLHLFSQLLTKTLHHTQIDKKPLNTSKTQNNSTRFFYMGFQELSIIRIRQTARMELRALADPCTYIIFTHFIADEPAVPAQAGGDRDAIDQAYGLLPAR